MGIARTGTATLVLTSLSLLACLATVLGTLEPLSSAGITGFAFVFPDWRLLAAAWIAATLGLVFVDRVIRRPFAGDQVAEAREDPAGWWAAPLEALGLLALGILPAVPGIGRYGGPLAYFFYVLRWWWILLLVGWAAARIDAAYGAPSARRLARVTAWRPSARLLLLDALVFAALVAWAVVTMPILRFTDAVHGDEPKYLRYCEALYQGHGVEIGLNSLFDVTPLDAPSALSVNLRLLAEAVRDDAHALVGDVGAFVNDPRGFKWNRAQARPGWFLIGKTGSFNQVHQPGLSLLLLPGYYLDRHFLGVRPGYQDEFPDDLVMTNATMLLLYALGGVALFRLVRNAVGEDIVAALLAAAVMMMLPMTSFAFQWYPEIPAAVIVIGVTNVLFFQRDRPWVAAAAGAAAAGLEWLHPRFILVSLALAVFAALWCRGAARRRFVVAYVLVFWSVCAFAYHLTGSWLPTAMYDADATNDAFALEAVPHNLWSNAFDRIWGVVPNAVAFLLVPAGWVILARENRRAAVFLGIVGLGLAIPTAGHGLGAAGATPGRHILAVLPLAAWPLAVLIQRCWRSPGWRALVSLAFLVTLQTAFAYNWSHEKPTGRFVDPDGRGWTINLAFPWLHTDIWRQSTANFHLFIAVVAIGLMLAASALYVARRRAPDPHRASRRRFVRPMVVTTVVTVALAIVATSANGEWTAGDYLPDPPHSLAVLAARLVEPNRFVAAMASSHGRITWRNLEPNSARDGRIAPSIEGHRATLDLVLEGEDGLAFGRARVDFGDGAFSPWLGVIAHTQATHTYARPGQYNVAAWFEMRDGAVRIVHQTVDITGEY